MLRLGLCCIFRDEPIKFRQTTALAVSRLTRPDALQKLSQIAVDNASALKSALMYCRANQIGAFRILSQLLPLKTHPQHGYEIDDLPQAPAVRQLLDECRCYARQHDLRLSFHPDQFVVLNSPRADVVASSVRELEYQAEVAELVGADVINVHAGGAYGNRQQSLENLARQLDQLSERIRSRLTLENDDKIYSPADLLPFCKQNRIPLVYDVHHHRCLPDGIPVDEATEAAWSTWDREPHFHISSPLNGWSGPRSERHHDFIDVEDFPASWHDRCMTVDIEAKAKEVAIARLRQQLSDRHGNIPPRRITSSGGG